MDEMDGFEDQKIPRNILVAENDSILDFKSPERFTKSKLTEISNSNVQQRKRTVTKSKKSIKSHKEIKGKQYVEKKRNLQESQPSIESSFFKSKSSGEEKDCTSDTKLALVCPLCFKTFKDLNSRTLHMKICAYKNNVPTKKLLDAIELQKRQEDERKSLGLLAAPVVQDKKKSSSSRRTSSCEETDFQLALALSKSLQEAEELNMINEIEGLPGLSNQFISTENVSMNQLHEGQLEKFGFANSKPPLLVRNKKRRRNEITSLQVRSQEERNRILTERISEILMGNEPITQIQKEEVKCDPLIEKKTYLRSRILQKLCNKGETLWNKAKLTKDQKCFYVPNLSEYIVPKEEQIEEEIDLEFANTSNAHDTGLSQYETKACSDEKVQQVSCTELYIKNENCENCQNRQFVNTVVTNWSTALNDSSASDIIIFVNDEKHIWAHKLVFYVQCSNILLDVTPNDTSLFTQIKEKICWTDISYNIALAFLEFIYCGIIERYSNVLEDSTNFSSLRNLARKYKVKELFGVLQMKEIQMKQAKDQVYNVHKKELISKKTDNLDLNEHNIENLDHSAKDSKLSESEKLNEQHSEKVHVIDESKFIDVKLKKDTITEDLWNEEINISEISALRTINVSPDLFDDGNDTMKSNKEMQNNTEHYDKIVNVEETGNVTSNRSELANQTILDTTNSPKFENITAFKSTEGDVNLSLGTPHFTTPKRNVSNLTKLKSNLSIFIEQFKRENAMSDSDIDSETSIQPACSKLLRNPFNVKQDDSLRTETNIIVGEPYKEKKDILCVFDCMTDSKLNLKTSCDDVEDDTDANINHKSLDDTIELSEFNLGECSRSDDNNSRNKNVMDADKELQDEVISSVSEDSLMENTNGSRNLQSENEDTFSQLDISEVEMSMYSKYKKGHENNSIVNYRKFVQGHILKDNEKSNTTRQECELKDNTDNISLLSDTNKDFELKTQDLISDFDEYKKTSQKDLCNFSNERVTNKEQCLFNNIMSPVNIAETTVKTQRMDTSNKLRYSKSDNNISLKSIRKNSFTSEESNIDKFNSMGSPILLSSSPEPDYNILNASKYDEGRTKKSASYSEKSIDYSHIFATEIYLANAYTDNSNDNTNMQLCTKETNHLDEEIISVATTNENNKLSTPNNFFADKFESNEKSLITERSSRKFQRKSVSEASLNINTRNTKINIPESYNSSRYRRTNESYFKANTSSEIIRDNVTPPPDYDNMISPELHEELNKYGLKIQKRKRAVKLLTYIYNELHPEVRITSSDTESESDKPPSKKVNCKEADVNYLHNYESQLILRQENTDMQLPVNVTNKDEQFDEPEFTSASDNPPNIKDVFLKLLRDKKELHNKVLAYEPLCINSLHSMLKAEGFKCKMNILMDFLDEQCITFYVQETRQKKDKVIST